MIGSLEIFLKEINNKRHFLIAHSKFTEVQITLLDEDIIQSILTKLPENFNAFIQTARAVEQYTMSFSHFMMKIENEEREMQV